MVGLSLIADAIHTSVARIPRKFGTHAGLGDSSIALRPHVWLEGRRGTLVLPDQCGVLSADYTRTVVGSRTIPSLCGITFCRTRSSHF